jgi:hypothetical protein
MKTTNQFEPAQAATFGTLVCECKRRGIARTTAFKLAREGRIQTFCIGRRRYVVLASLEALAFESKEGEGA